MSGAIQLRVWKIISLLFFGCACAFLGYQFKSTENTSSKAIRENTSQYKFISPLLAVSRPDPSVPTGGYDRLSKEVASYISDRKKTGLIDSASVYLINYTQSGSFAINEDEGYNPASLMKVVIMMTYFKQAENTPRLLESTLLYSPALDQALKATPYDTQSVLVPNKSYSVQTLIDKMIIDSDNGAMNLLLAAMSDAHMQETYTALGIRGPQAGTPYTISAKDYSFFFRVLYNATYLSRDYSEKALSILSQARYKDGLVAGLSQSTIVAHKFGEHVNAVAGQVDTFELHDCGIVYQNDDTFLLCVMTKGKQLTDLSDTIAIITKMVSKGR